MPGTAIVWCRRDLRLHDHPVLQRAIADFERVVPLYVLDHALLAGRWASANRAWFLAGSLTSLAADAAVRQLRATGWINNRVRMIAASFLTKHLLVDWRIGEAHFMEHLVDGDPASNNGGWQLAASTGTDPQPYFRIFNPTLQGRRHDPAGDYVRRWVPELGAIRGADVHKPPSGAYLPRIVDHAMARARSLAAYEAASASQRSRGPGD